GSPTHPAYPTGHGTVAGACITILKFFFDGNFVIPHPVVPGSDGLSLLPYTGGDAGQMTVNGELNKLAHNISFGHGIPAGIHWRSDTDSSIQLGEALAISVLQDRALTTTRSSLSISLRSTERPPRFPIGNNQDGRRIRDLRIRLSVNDSTDNRPSMFLICAHSVAM